MDKNKVIFKKFSGTGELSRYLADAVIQPAFKHDADDGSYSETASYEKWSGTATYKEADDLLLYGCKSLQKKIEDAGVAKMRAKLNSFTARRKVFSTVVGFAPNVPAFLAGTPNSMINLRQVKVRQRVLNFMYNTTVSWTVSAEDIVKAAANVVSAIMIIEAGGVRVNLWAGEAFKQDDCPDILWMVKVKDSGQRMDTMKMAYPIAHPSMLRRHWFRLLETTEGVPSDYTRGYGTVIKTEERCKETLDNAGMKNIQRVLCFSEVQDKTPQEIAKMLLDGKD